MKLGETFNDSLVPYTDDVYDDGTGGFVDAEGNAVVYDESTGGYIWPTYSQGSTVEINAVTPEGVVEEIKAQIPTNPGSGFKIPKELEPQVNRILADLARQGGQWAARQINGQTLLYRNQQGGIGTFNIKGFLIPGAIVAALFVLSGRK